MAETPNRDSFIEINSLVTAIPGENPSGALLRYERIYDDIRDARREDDDSVSYGIWQYDLKRSDWGRVESLCSEALANQSKDLQIAGWLSEAWTVMGGVDGLTHGLILIKELTNNFWDSIYPVIESNNTEYRSQFYDWLDKTLSHRLVKLVFIPNEFGEGVTVADWLAAQRLDSVLKRTPNADKLAKKAEERGQVNFKQCQVILSRVGIQYIQDYLNSLYAARSAVHDLKDSIDDKFPDNTLSFEELTKNLEEMVRVYKGELSTRKPVDSISSDESLTLSVSPVPSFPEEQADLPLEKTVASVREVMPVSTQTREQAYKQLSDIANLLENLEPHSPAPQILRRVIMWENKSLMEIFNEIGSSPEDLVALMRFLGIGGNKVAEKVNQIR